MTPQSCVALNITVFSQLNPYLVTSLTFLVHQQPFSRPAFVDSIDLHFYIPIPNLLTWLMSTVGPYRGRAVQPAPPRERERAREGGRRGRETETDGGRQGDWESSVLRMARAVRDPRACGFSGRETLPLLEEMRSPVVGFCARGTE